MSTEFDKHPRLERTFLMLKPDAVKRGLMGEIVGRIERRGLKILALKMVQADRAKIDGFYPGDDAFVERLGKKTLATYEKYGLDPISELGTGDAMEIGSQVRGWLLDFMTSGPVVLMVVQGVHAISMIRKLIGDTMPANAAPGTVRGDFSTESAASANRDRRAVFNLVHATETEAEAAHELRYWFSGDEIADYSLAHDYVMFPVTEPSGAR